MTGHDKEQLFRRRRNGWAAAALYCLLGGCVSTDMQVAALKRSELLRSLPAETVWTRQPTATVALGRGLGVQAEQIVALENETAMRGDNVLVMRAHLEGGDHLPPPDLEDFLKRNRAFGTPFEPPIENALRQATDAAGPYVWAEMRARGGTVCVLAMRRIGREDANLPDDVRALDVTLRNCVRGDRDIALAPIGADRIAMANTGLGPFKSRVISHLAGPRPLGSTAPALGERP